MWLWKCGGKQSNKEIADNWGIHVRQVSRYLQKWSPKWDEVGNRYSRLMIDREFLMASQPKEFASRYAKPISHMTDGSVVQCDVPRTSSLRAHLLYADKIKHQGVLGIDMTTPLGLCFLSMPLCGGKCSEKRYMQVISSTLIQLIHALT